MRVQSSSLISWRCIETAPAGSDGVKNLSYPGQTPSNLSTRPVRVGQSRGVPRLPVDVHDDRGMGLGA